MHRRVFQPLLVLAQRQDRCGLFSWEAPHEIGFEFSFQHRDTLSTSAAVADRVLYDDFFSLAAIFEEHLYAVGDRRPRALYGGHPTEVFLCVLS